MPRLTIDRRVIQVPDGTKVIDAAEQLGIMIPRFCYHPALGSVGACRVCAVKFLEGPVKGVEMSCQTDAKDGMVVSTTHPEAMDFRRYVIEWLMLHHPHDCPVCDEGGECLLQDETVAGGHGLRRYLGKKRTYHDQYLGTFIQHEMNRCIQCWRCRNFYQEFAGYRDLGAMQIGNRIYFGRARDGALESPFAGNLVDLCPTGVYTDKPARFKGRRWDLERAPTLCPHCSLGCNTVGSARYREMARLEARLNEAVNGYFICDRGRFGFYFANHPDRPRQAVVHGREVSLAEGIQQAAAELARISQAHVGAVACLGSARSSLETQGELARLCRAAHWPEPRYFLDRSRERRVRTAISRLDSRMAVSLGELADADFIIAVGADPINEAPMLALALRQAWRRGAAVVVIDPRPVSLPFAFEHIPVVPGDMGFGVGVLVKGALAKPLATGMLSPAAARYYETLSSEYPANPALQDRLVALGLKLGQSRRPVIICGTDIVRETTPDLAADLVCLLREAGQNAGLFYLLPGPNAFGAALMPASSPAPAALLPAIEQGEVKALVLVERDLFWDCPDQERLSRALDRLELLVVLDYVPSPSVKRADIFLPTVPLFEDAPSSFVNQEGRLQQAQPVHAGGAPLSQVSPGSHPPRTFLDYVPGGEPTPAGEILPDIAAALPGIDLEISNEDLWAWLARQNPVFARISALKAEPLGVRLLPAESPHVCDPDQATAWKSEEAPPGHFQLLLTDQTFGGEELASYSPYIQAVAEPPRLVMHQDDAARLGLAPGDAVRLELSGGPLEMPLGTSPHMAPGVLVLPRSRGLTWQKLTGWPAWVPESSLQKAEGGHG
jgi:NADH-quinone oxidoreductase subunit G